MDLSTSLQFSTSDQSFLFLLQIACIVHMTDNWKKLKLRLFHFCQEEEKQQEIQALLENLRMLPHAPGVQMADIPEDSVDINKDKEEEDSEADKDKRNTVKIMDKKIEHEAEFEAGKSGNKNSVNHGETNGAEPMETDSGATDS